MARTKAPKAAPATPKPTKPETKSRAARKKSATASVDVDVSVLQDLAANGTKEHLHSKKTTGGYDRYLKAAREFVESMFQERDSEMDGPGGFDPLSMLDDEDVDKDLDDEVDLSDPEFRNAFDGPPTKYTPHAIRLFLTWKCFHQEKGIQTAQGAHAAFVAEYDAL